MSRSILIVESEPWLGDHYVRVLEKNDFATKRVTNAYAAIDSIDDETPDAIVMSLLLSGTAGIGLLHELQTYIDTTNIPVIVCSGFANVNLDELAPYGVRRLLDSKSMKPDDLAAAVRSVLA